jgi:hypothetical protein
MATLTAAGTAWRPGRRVVGYRNSVPRIVKLIGLGEAARVLAEDIAAASAGGVIVGPKAAPGEPLDAAVSGIVPGAVVVVLHAREVPAQIPFVLERTAATLSVVMLDPSGDGATGNGQTGLRNLADMFASTSDPDFVRDLVANLAS